MYKILIWDHQIHTINIIIIFWVNVVMNVLLWLPIYVTFLKINKNVFQIINEKCLRQASEKWILAMDYLLWNCVFAWKDRIGVKRGFGWSILAKSFCPREESLFLFKTLSWVTIFSFLFKTKKRSGSGIKVLADLNIQIGISLTHLES